MGEKTLQPGNKYLLQHNSTRVRANIKSIEYKLDVNTLEHMDIEGPVKLNDVVKATIKTATPIQFDSYKKLRTNGGAIIIDETSHVTVGALMIQ